MHTICRLMLMAVAVLLPLLCGCGPAGEDKRARQEASKGEAERREILRRAVEGGSEESVAIKLVQSAPAAQGDGTMEHWLQRQMGTKVASVLFPRWETRRQGMGKYEVIYTCTLLYDDGRVGGQGYAWPVDIVLKWVAPPRELIQDELGVRSFRDSRDRRGGARSEKLQAE